MSKTLSDIRVKIDAIDNQVHDLLMERASLVSSVAAAKKREGLQIVQPAREARMMRRLLSRHGGPLPRNTIVRIWRELVGSVALLQTGFSVIVAGSDGDTGLWDMAKNYFGSSVPMRKVQGTQNVLQDVRETKDSFGVMPWPHFTIDAPWWGHLLNQNTEDRLSIICALPHGMYKQNDTDAFERGLIVSDIRFMPSDEDITFIGIETHSEFSRDRLVDCLEKTGVELLNVYRGQRLQEDDKTLHLAEVKGYYDDDAPEISEIQKLLGEQYVYCGVVGGYPVIPDIRATENSSEDDS